MDVKKVSRSVRRARPAAAAAVIVCLYGALAGSAGAGTFVVDSVADDAHGYAAGTCPSPCTLRDALLAANSGAGLDAIAFAIPGAGVTTISPLTALPSVTAPVFLDGYTQPGASTNSLAVGGDAVLLVELSGAAVGGGTYYGLRLEAGASGSTVRGLVVNDFQYNGVVISGAADVTFAGNYVGVDPAGAQKRPNGWSGLVLTDGAHGCTIGGLSPEDRNVISGNSGAGLTIGSSTTTDNTVVGNFFGTNAAGTQPLRNQTGVTIATASGNVVGGDAPGARNVISGNFEVGVSLGNASSGNTVVGNAIGTAADGVSPLGNIGPGVWVYDGLSGPSTDNVIGGRGAGQGNVIAFNRVGVRVTNQFAAPSAGNTIVGNSIHDNAELGIDLAGDGPTANDPLDQDAGPNGLLNAPVVTSAALGAGLLVAGTLGAATEQAFTIDVYASSICDASGFGEATRYLGSVQTTTDGNGDAVFSTIFAATGRYGEAVSATATDEAGNTSELSACHAVGARLRRKIPHS